MSNLLFDVKLIENNDIVICGKFNGFLNNNVINFNDGVNNIFDLNKLVLERISDDYKIIFDFVNLTCEYTFNDMSVKMMVDVTYKKICSNSLFLKYKLIDTGNIYEYSVNW